MLFPSSKIINDTPTSYQVLWGSLGTYIGTCMRHTGTAMKPRYHMASWRRKSLVIANIYVTLYLMFNSRHFTKIYSKKKCLVTQK